MSESSIWPGEVFSILRKNSEGFEYKIIARKTFVKDGVLILDDHEESEDIVITYNSDILRQLLENGRIPKWIGEPLLEELDHHKIKQDEFDKFLEKNPQASEQEKSEAFQLIHMDNPSNRAQISYSIRHLLSIKDILEEEKKISKRKPLFNKHLRQQEDFGITKAVMDRLVYLPDLLKEAKLKRVAEDSDHYFISSDFSSSSKSEPIGLEYHFIASCQDSAEQIFEIYKDEMGKEALKVLLGFWIEANALGMFDFTSEIVKIIGHISDSNRNSYFSVKEKKRFWSLVKLLENTKLTLRIPYKGKKGNKEKLVVIEHRLIEISARDAEKNEEGEGYPNKIKVTVLNPEEFKEKAQLATAIANGTAQLPPQDIMLALTVQTRASQVREFSESQFDEEYLIKKAHLDKTKASNPSVAKKRLHQKLDKIRERGCIKEWSKKNDRYCIEHNRVKKDPQQ